MSAGLRAVIVDDEAMSRRALRTLLTGVDWVDCVGEATDASSAVETLRALEPDLVFLDVKLPDGSGLQVLERYERPLAIIFTTAFDEYALTAFDIGAVDFLRKPFGQARLMQALERARAHLSQPVHAAADEVPLTERLATVGSSGRQVTRIFVRDRGSVIPLRTDSISRCEADGDYVAIYAGTRRYLVYVNLGDIEAKLDPDTFVRVHRSHLVNLDYVEALAPADPSRLELHMRGGTRIVASRMGTQLLKARMR